MSEGTAAAPIRNVSLLCRAGARAGARFPLGPELTRIGRAPDNDAVIDGPDAGTVSLYHCEVLRTAEGFRIHDCNSTNGTWLDGERITDAALGPEAVLRLGQQGPEFSLVAGDSAPEPLNRTIEVHTIEFPDAAPASASDTHEEMLSAAVDQARRMRARGLAGQTMTIMRDVLEEALRQTRRRHRIVAWALLAALVSVSGAGAWRILAMVHDKRAIDAQLRDLEAELQKAHLASERDQLLSRLNGYQEQAELIQRSLLYRIGPHAEGDFVTSELRAVMQEFGAEIYSLPPDFVDRVHHYIDQDCGPERPKVASALADEASRLQTIRGILEQARMPADLAYIPIVESALVDDAESGAGAVGPWQMTAPTARAYGLRVDGKTDERKDLVKSTGASCRYLKDLILDFGAGSSVMLALAAYNSGAAKVKQAVSRTVLDPIQQRNFWYLYRTQALPAETREYVPKVFAAILIGRNPRHFGF